MSSSPPQSPSLLSPTTDDNDAHYKNDPRLSPLEAELLNEYRRLREILDVLRSRLSELAQDPSTQLADGLRTLERQMMPVQNAFKSSVYQIVMQQGGEFDGGEDAGDVGSEG